MYKVIKFGGYVNSKQRLITETDNSSIAMDTAIAVARTMKHGYVQLLKDGKEVIKLNAKRKVV